MMLCPYCHAMIIGDVMEDQQERLVKLRDGEVVLYRRIGSERWQARFKLPDNRWHRITTKRSNIQEASRVATEAYDKARFRHADGLIAVSRRFRDVSKLTIAKMDNDTKNGVGKVIYIDYKQIITAYLNPFFGNTAIDKINQDDITRFDAWRTKKMERMPAASTIMNHNAALHKVFDTAIEQGWLQRKNIPELKNKGKKGKRRPDFTMDEWRRVTANLQHWSKKAREERTRQMRELLRDYVLILANTGIRTGKEADDIKWKHLRWHQDKDERYLMISVKGKTGERELVARHGTEVFFQRIQSRFEDLAKMSFDELLKAKIDQYVFRLTGIPNKEESSEVGVDTSKRTENLSHTFNQFLVEHKLLEDKQGNHRTLYSLRHTYATMRLVKDKVPMHDIAKQMGTSIAMLEKHYSHLKPIMVAELLAGKKHEPRPKAAPKKPAIKAENKKNSR
jgi:integrase